VLVERGLLKRAGYGRVPYRREDVDAVLRGVFADVEQEMEDEQAYTELVGDDDGDDMGYCGPTCGRFGDW